MVPVDFDQDEISDGKGRKRMGGCMRLLIHNHHVMAANMANAFSLDYYSVLGMYNVRSPKYTLIVGLTT